MKRPHQLLLYLCTSLSSCVSCRTYATSYSGRVVQRGSNGCTITVEVEPPTLVHDVRGYALPRRDLVCHAIKILHSSNSDDPFLDLSQYLQTLTITLTPSEVSEILKSLRTSQKALEFFHFAATSIPGFRHDTFTYNRILTILSRSPSPPSDLVSQIVDEMECSGVRGSISTINILIGIIGSVGELERCLDLAKKWELRFNCYTYKCLLQAYLRSKEVVKAFGVFEDMRRRGYKLDIFSYNMLVDSLAKDEKCDVLTSDGFIVEKKSHRVIASGTRRGDLYVLQPGMRAALFSTRFPYQVLMYGINALGILKCRLLNSVVSNIDCVISHRIRL